MRRASIIRFSLDHPKLITSVMVLLTLILAAMTYKIKVDTDPENMLSPDEPVRVFHHQVKEEFTLHDVVVLGVVNDKDPDGVFNPETLKRIDELARFASTLKDPEDPSRRVVTRDVIAPHNVDSIEQAGLGQVRFDWLMEHPPRTREEALAIRDKALSNPLLKGTMVSEDGKALCVYLPITKKDFAYQVRKQLLDKIETFPPGDEEYHITGLPVAEDTFGVEMFVQMAVSAPLAMVAIFLLMLLFFKKIKMIAAPMIVAVVTVICTMGLLIGTGHTVHIMSSMIPIFLMPIAVVDSIHILSEFFDTYQSIRDRGKTIVQVMDHLFMPMLYTSLTSAAGFASLALTPIPPVQVFGIFVAIGILLAWVFTILFIPAYVMLLPEASLSDFGVKRDTTGQATTAVSRHLQWLGSVTYQRAKLILGASVIALVIAGYGISKIVVNDNPVKWFTKSHPIRVADTVLNQHFGGTYEAYLILEGAQPTLTTPGALKLLEEKIQSLSQSNQVPAAIAQAALDSLASVPADASLDEGLTQLEAAWEEQRFQADDAGYEAWGLLTDLLGEVRNRDQVFKRPDMLRYIARLEEHVEQAGTVGKTNSVTDVVQKVHQELFAGDPAYYRVPDSVNGVAQTLISFQNSHKPDDLFHLVTPDYRKANLWIQLKNGDNLVMERTIRDVEEFLRDNPPPVPLTHAWAGLTYLNVVWQNKMVFGMLESFLSSFAVVLVMMVILFRSVLWGLLAMIPITVTIGLIYGLIGLVGKDYDMPVAVLSSLTLGLAIDFAIHFLERSRMAYQATGSWLAASRVMFEEPARAITRNVIVIAIGFTPLLAAPLVPYKTVGFFLASIMAVSGVGTMFILPAMIRLLEPWLFRKLSKHQPTTEANP